jgi:outer membrane protein W
MKKRGLLILLLLVTSAAGAFAQAPASDVGLWVISPQLNETTFLDEDFDDLTVDFDEDLGFGVSYNHFWTGAFSTELAVQKYGADMNLSISGSPTVVFGELDVTSVSGMAQLHFNRTGRVSVWGGAGGAWISGEFDADEEDVVELESELALTAGAGLNVGLTDRLALAGTIQYTKWSATAENDDEFGAIDIDPLVFMAGLRIRF